MFQKLFTMARRYDVVITGPSAFICFKNIFSYVNPVKYPRTDGVTLKKNGAALAT